MSWNPVLNFFMEIKQAYADAYSEDSWWDYQDNNSFTDCLSCWVWYISNLGHPKRFYYQNILNNLSLNEYDNMLLIRYKDLDIDWDAYDGFYMECRSVVIDIKKNKLVLTPFHKFRNLNECEENSLENIQEKIKNAQKVEVTDKLDGSMCSMRFYNNRIVMSGSRALDRDTSFRLQNYYNWVCEHKNFFDMAVNFPEYTFIFEGIFPDDVHVVHYNEQMIGLHLVGMRNVKNGVELSYQQIAEVAEYFSVPHVQIFNMTFEEAYQDAINDGRKSNEGEGYVVDIDGYKIKVKYNDYVQMHHAIGQMISPNAIIKAIRGNYWDDFYSKIPLAYQPQAMDIATNVFNYIRIFNDNVYYWKECIDKACNYTEDRKVFMIAVNDIVPKYYAGAVRCKFLGKEMDYLQHIKYDDILSYLDLMGA